MKRKRTRVILTLTVVPVAIAISLAFWEQNVFQYVSEILQQLRYQDEDSRCAISIPIEEIHLPSTSPSLPPPPYGRRLNKLAEEHDWCGALWMTPQVEMGIFHQGECPDDLNEDEDLKRLNNCLLKARRKEWEFAQSIYAMKMFGLFGNESNALGVGCGHESIVFYLSIYLKHVTATDIYAKGGWNMREGDPRMLTAPNTFSPHEYPEERLSIVSMDGTDLHFADNSFEIVFSFSSIEHFYYLSPNGFFKAARRSVQEMGRVAKINGLVTVSTEVILNGRGHYDWVAGLFPMRNFFLPTELEEYVIRPAKQSGLCLVDEIDWSISNNTLARSLPLGRCRHQFPHMIIRDKGVVWTSISLVFQKRFDPKVGFKKHHNKNK